MAYGQIMNIEAKQKRILKRLNLKEFRVQLIETIVSEVYILATNAEQAEEKVATDSEIDWEQMSARGEYEAEEVVV